ncbi:MAG: pirin family protein, partial [bacterium]
MEHFLAIDERMADIGDFIVGRLLPVRQKRQVGPITFLDHMGPVEIGAGRYMDVDQHPHIGLATLTYLFEGTIEHRDSLGSVQLVKPGDVGFMTAGQGITHTERTPAHLRNGKKMPMHGYQVWIALPLDKEEMAPSFEFVSKSELPVRNENGTTLRLIAGNGFGMESPVHVHSPMFIAEVNAEENTTLSLDGKLEGEIAIAVANGSSAINDKIVDARQMLISSDTKGMSLDLKAGTRALLLGGKPFAQERYLLWNFVSS